MPTASVVDAAVALAAERIAGPGEVVEVLTSDPRDLQALASTVDADVDVTAV